MHVINRLLTVCFIGWVGIEPIVRVLKPQIGYCLVRRWVPEQTTKSGVIIQDDAASYGFGVIDAIHPHEGGRDYEVGTIVLIDKDKGTPVQWNGNVCLMVKIHNIIGLVEDSE